MNYCVMNHRANQTIMLTTESLSAAIIAADTLTLATRCPATVHMKDVVVYDAALSPGLALVRIG